MDIVVRLEEVTAGAPVLAHVDSLPVVGFGSRTRREVVTLYGQPDARVLALAIAAAVEGRDVVAENGDRRGLVRHLGVAPEGGALGDAAWRDPAGRQLSQDLEISGDRISVRADELIGRCGSTLRRVAADLAMPDWPEGTDRAVRFSLVASGTGANGMPRIDEGQAEQWLDDLRSGESDSFAFALDGEDA